jgi:hypothetical protein
MSYPASLALLVCALTVIATAAFLPFLNSSLRKEHRPRFPLVSVAFAVIALSMSLPALFGTRGAQADIVGALGLTTALMAGLSLKWLLETAALKKPTVHEAVLFRALLVAPLAIAFLPRFFGVRPTPPTLLLWFLNGFFWHTVFSDVTRLMTDDPVIIRRREPPTLPHDFRKPEAH